MSEWRVYGERTLYESRWLRLLLTDVELPDGQRFEHHVVRMQRVAAAVVVNAEDRVLLMWRHRFITKTWGWEVPTGIIEAGEAGADTAAREVLEETGWRPGAMQLVLRYQPANGIVDTEHEIYVAHGAEHVGAPRDVTEADRIEWLLLADVPGLIAKGELVAGPSLVGLLHLLATRSADHPSGPS